MGVLKMSNTLRPENIQLRKELERLRKFILMLREEFLLNTQNYPKEYHAMFHRKFKRVEAAMEGELNER
jgi:hypothetical protein